MRRALREIRIQLVGHELLSRVVSGASGSSGFPADLSLIDSIGELHTGDDVGELAEGA